MKPFIHLALSVFLSVCLCRQGWSQSTANPGPYCTGPYSGGNCVVGGPPNSQANMINDFIDNFSTSGGIVNITNNNSGCNNNPNNYVNYYCQHYLITAPAQTITCTMRSGITFAQGFVIFVDWNQDNVFQNPGERVAATANIIAPATNATLTFTIPAGQPNGAYRMRVRCSFNTPGTAITPCGTALHGETEDYGLFVGPPPPNSGVITATLSGNSPICSGQTLTLGVSSTPSAGISYSWTGPGGFSAVTDTPVIPNASVQASGVYTMNIGGACPVSKTIAATVVNYPDYTITPVLPQLCQGDSLRTSISFAPNSGSPNAFSYQWVASPGATLSSPTSSASFVRIDPQSQLQYPVSYSVTVSSTLLSCPVTQSMTAMVNNPAPPVLSLPAPFCDNTPAFSLNATPGGGTWAPGPANSASGSFTPALINPGIHTLSYSVTVNGCMVSADGTISVSRFNTPALSMTPGTLCANDPSLALMSLVQTTVGGSWTGLSVSNNLFLTAGLPSGNYTMTYSTQSTPVASVCPAFSVYSFYVYNPPVPVIASISPLCNTAQSVQLQASIPGGTWSGPGISAAGIQTPSLGLPGTNTLNYSAGQGTCQASATQTFHISRFNSAALTRTFETICARQGTLDLMAGVQNTVPGTWSGPHIAGMYTLSVPRSLPSATYTMTYINLSTPNASLCPDTSVLNVFVYNPPAPSIQAAGPFCSTSPTVQLIATPASGSWKASSYLSPAGVLTPSLSGPGFNLVQYVTGTSTCQAEQSIQISIETFVSARITGKMPDLCNTGQSFNLSKLSTGEQGSWSGPGVRGTLFDPGLSGEGNFILRHQTASSPSGLCPDEDSVTVKVLSLSPPVVTRAGPFCNLASPVQLIAQPPGGLFGGGNGLSVDAKGLFQPALAMIGDNVLTYSITEGPCLSSVQLTVTVEKFVPADLEKPVPPFCRNGAPVNLNSFVQNPGGDWSGPGVAGSMFDPRSANIGADNVIVYTSYSIPSRTLCPDTSHVRIEVRELPPVRIAADQHKGCAPLEVVFNTPNVNSGNGSWHFDDGSKAGKGLSASHLFRKAGHYKVSFVYSDGGVCPPLTTAPVSIQVDETPLAEFSVPEKILVSEGEVTLVNSSSPLFSNQYTWTITEQDTLNEINPRVKFDKPGRYRISLLAVSAGGCKSETSQYIEVENDFGFYIPNAFTPNFDGLNDVFIPVFTPYGLDHHSYELEIFDRWGHSLFRSTDSRKGWDGTQGNEDIKPDVYTFRISFKDLEGTAHTKTGHVSLIR